jgi:hypothetical protein
MDLQNNPAMNNHKEKNPSLYIYRPGKRDSSNKRVGFNLGLPNLLLLEQTVDGCGLLHNIGKLGF